MFVIDVIPLASGAPAGTLSYRTKEKVAVGALMSVPLRKKTVPGMVAACRPVMEAKSELKSAHFMLRSAAMTKIGSVPKEYAEAAASAAAHHATSIAGVLGTLLVPVLSEGMPEKFTPGPGFAEQHIEGAYEERVLKYVAYAKKGPVLLAAPTLTELERLVERFKASGIVPIVLAGTVAPKKRAKLLEAAATAAVVIATPSFAWVPIRDLSRIIVERPSAGTYAFQKRPYLDARMSLFSLAKARQVPVTFGDFPLPLEYRSRQAPKPPTKAKIIDPRTEETKAFSAVPDEMLEEIRKTASNGGRVAVLAVRKGYAPAVICRDCGQVVVDERDHPLALVSSKGKPVLRTADGKVIRDADAICSHCGSWNLMGLGVGIERVAEELKEKLPDVPVIRLDADEVKTGKAAKMALARFKDGTIVVGTEGMIPLLDPAEPIDLIAIASTDSLLALPFWRARERLVRIGYQLAERSKKLLISTRLPEDSAFSAIQGEPDFFEEEAAMRKTLSYPPYGHLIVVHASGTKDRVEDAAALVKRAFGELAFTRLPDRLMLRGRWRASFVAKIAAEHFPDASLSERLSMLPPWIEVRIDAESFW